MSVTDPIKRELWLFSETTGLFCAFPLIAISVCVMVLDESLGFSISAVPSVAPKRVRTRSVSAVQIEVIWEALPTVPERVLGYEVRYDFSFFFPPSNSMIIEPFPVACLSAHNRPFIVLKISFFLYF